MEEKLISDTTAWARSLAELRGRNSQWAVLAVTESRSITAAEALENGVVELLAATQTAGNSRSGRPGQG